MKLFLVISILTVCMSSPGGAEYEPPPCRKLLEQIDRKPGTGFGAMTLAQEQCRRDYMGIVPLAQRVRRGEQVFRAYVSLGERAIPILIEYVRGRGGNARLEIGTFYDGRRRISAPISEEAFRSVLARWGTELATAATEQHVEDAQRRADKERGVETVCITWSGAEVEVADGQEVRAFALDPCKPRQNAFMQAILAAAVRDIGTCASGYAANDDPSPGARLTRCMAHSR